MATKYGATTRRALSALRTMAPQGGTTWPAIQRGIGACTLGLVAAVVLAIGMMPHPAAAEKPKPLELGIETMARAVTDALTKERLAGNLPADILMGFLGFRDSALGAPCPDLSKPLTDQLKARIQELLTGLNLGIGFADTGDPEVIGLAVVGTWAAGPEGAMGLTIRVADIRELDPREVATAHTSVVTDTLPPAAHRCFFRTRAEDLRITTERPVLVRTYPAVTAPELRTFDTGETIQISGRLISDPESDGGEEWVLVRVPWQPDEIVFSEERFGFAVNVLPKPPPPQIKPLDEVRTVASNTTVRSGPGMEQPSIGVLAAEDLVRVTGLLEGPEGGPWLRIVYEDQPAFVLATNLPEPTPEAVQARPFKTDPAATPPRRVEPVETWQPEPTKAPVITRPTRVRPLPIPPARRLDLKVWTGKGSYREGEPITVFVQSNEDVYLRLVYRSQSGQLVQLLPNAAKPDALFPAGQVHRVPGFNDRFRIVPDCKGRCRPETVYVFASSQPLGPVADAQRGGMVSVFGGNLADVKAASFACPYPAETADILDQPPHDCGCGYEVRGGLGPDARACFTGSFVIDTYP